MLAKHQEEDLDALYFMIEGKDHKAKIKDLNYSDIKRVNDKLFLWAGIKLIND